ncbi:hypothetical protein B296_00003041 [Ensete ventricosum]|uniref:Uncharacterized protein n=1 Tax=Ensete ventricosum TaxID=4639 RepID=A0A427A7N9_ENSVE|nr:hypothetical protein B296_00003041 [Ensete ventricosum]
MTMNTSNFCCHFDSGSSADLVELSLQDKTFTRGGHYGDQVRVSAGPILPHWFALGHVVWLGKGTTIIPIILPSP